ncbi:MAG TPA: zf-HC2 domain-containing protein [Candidatus Acidoferrales bacterium]|nr:zf-HC2 domain-containing protein [Candidatus Acidoferrales bacterium]
MTCHETERQLPGYLDGGALSAEHSVVREHLESCGNCREQLELYRRLAVCMAKTEPVAVPADLVCRIRVQASRSSVRSGGAMIRQLWDRGLLVFQNILEPLAVPATGGLLTAIAVFALIAQSILVGAPVRADAADAQFSFIQPASVESLASFPISAMSDSGTLLLEATVDSTGEISSYRILSGPDNPALERQVYQILLFSRFRPQVNLGLPTNGGHVMLGFNSLRVRG